MSWIWESICLGTKCMSCNIIVSTITQKIITLPFCKTSFSIFFLVNKMNFCCLLVIPTPSNFYRVENRITWSEFVIILRLQKLKNRGLTKFTSLYTCFYLYFLNRNTIFPPKKSNTICSYRSKQIRISWMSWGVIWNGLG